MNFLYHKNAKPLGVDKWRYSRLPLGSMLDSWSNLPTEVYNTLVCKSVVPGKLNSNSVGFNLSHFPVRNPFL